MITALGGNSRQGSSSFWGLRCESLLVTSVPLAPVSTVALAHGSTLPVHLLPV